MMNWQPFIENPNQKEGILTYQRRICFIDVKKVGASNLKGHE